MRCYLTIACSSTSRARTPPRHCRAGRRPPPARPGWCSPDVVVIPSSRRPLGPTAVRPPPVRWDVDDLKATARRVLACTEVPHRRRLCRDAPGTQSGGSPRKRQRPRRLCRPHVITPAHDRYAGVRRYPRSECTRRRSRGRSRAHSGADMNQTNRPKQRRDAFTAVLAGRPLEQPAALPANDPAVG